MIHRPAFKRLPDPDCRYVGTCSCGWADENKYYYAGYAENSANRHAGIRNEMT